MNATVITTGPGVIIDTATASRNCRSVSQWKCCTTPPWRYGTIARPLPKTNRPAPAKYPRIVPSRPTDGSAGPAARSSASDADLLPPPAPPRGAVRTRTGTRPDARNTQTISVPVHAVTPALSANNAQRNRSRPSVIRTSLIALRAMTAITAAPTPRSEEHTSELQSQFHLVCRLLLEKKKKQESLRYINKKKKAKI